MDKRLISVYVEVGRRLAAARLSIGKTQEELAQDIGVSKSRLSNWETGIRPADPIFLAKLCRTWGFSLDWFFMGELGGVQRDRLAPLQGAYTQLCQETGPRRGRPFGSGHQRHLSAAETPPRLLPFPDDGSDNDSPADRTRGRRRS